MNNTPFLNIAYAGIGLDAYWPQFPGLKEKLEADMAVVAGKLARPGRECGRPWADRYGGSRLRGRATPAAATRWT